VHRTLVLGIGNTLLGDEGAGVHVLEHLRGVATGEALELIDAGTLGFTLLPLLEDHQQLIVLDAANLGAAPGAVRVFNDIEMDNFLSRPRRSVHEVGVWDMVSLARLGGFLPQPRALVGVQPAMIGWQHGPSPAVAAALPVMAGHVVEIVARWRRSNQQDAAA
jgi:hydrogenase maturation protease